MFLLLLLFINLVGAGRDIPVRKCCPEKTFYKMGFDWCKEENERMNTFAWPLVFDRLNNRLIDDVTADDFILTTAESLDNCTDGEVAVSSTDFTFFTDGSLRLNKDGRNLSSDQFCLNQIAEPNTFAVRFCIRDPCKESTSSCIRKCCPNGKIILNKTDLLCHPTTLPFQVDFRDEKGQSVELSPSSYIVRDGVVPKCKNGSYSLLSEKYGDVFYVLPNGQIYIPSYPEEDRASSDYCIDNLIDNEDTTVMAIILIKIVINLL